MKRLAKLLAGGLWFFFCLLMGIKLFFPTEAVGQRLVYGMEEATGGSFKLILDDVSAWTLSGLQADQVQILRQKKKRRRNSDDEDPPLSLFAELDSIAARIQILPFLRGSQLVTLKGKAYDGTIGGELGMDGDVLVLELIGEDLDLSLYPASLPDGEALQLSGRLHLESDLHLDKEDVDNSTGEVRLEIDQLAILNEAFADSFDEALLELEADDGKLLVKRGTFQGEKIQVEVSGEIALNKRIGKSRLDIQIKVDLDASYDLLAKASGLKRARDSDGTYHFECTGTLERKRCRSDRQAARGTSRRSSTSRRNRSDDEDIGLDRFQPDESAAERRERRQERIRDRRARSRDRRRGDNGALDRPDPSRSRRGRRGREEEFDEDYEPEDEPFEEEPPFEDDLPLPELEEVYDKEEDPGFEDELLQDALGDPFMNE
jgi:type II secretion system protein N